ncbi:hypothetical protein POM88_053297 [Heracleum sosnowskyi]|uniref:Replication protein A OB domain-containing protein n=1 Tax=Heracleum sosnowskyi TaxID=360622 RepID=A0AAD8GPR6_9APIA|nr:hypothetical protein POM88_053297 [Heracleum sosnowskyi]
MASTKLDSFRDLRKGKYDWKVTARIMNLWRGYTKSGEPFQGFNLLLLDNKRCRIHAFVPGNVAPQIEPKLQRPQGQLPSDTEANPGKKEPNHQVHAVTLRSGKSTREEEVLNQPAVAISEKQPVQVEPVEEAEMQAAEKEKKSKAAESQGIYPPPPFPGRLQKQKISDLEESDVFIEQCVFDFYDLADLKQLSQQTTYLTDVVGIIKKPEPVLSKLINKFGQDQTTTRFQITDGRTTVKVTFWDAFAEQLAEALKEDFERPVIIIIGSCRVTEWKGVYLFYCKAKGDICLEDAISERTYIYKNNKTQIFLKNRA